jgi:NAD(P)-dependent dehydrogenase (short-subunit alcohol dehydrogenase family)
MSLQGKQVLITGGSRGIGRGIALKLAKEGAQIAINYVQNEGAAKDTLSKVRAKGSDGFIIQADVSKPDDIRHLFNTVQAEFGTLDVFVNNARPEVPLFFAPPFEITPEQWRMAFDSQAQAFFLGVRAAAPLMNDGGRVIAVTYAPGCVTGGFQPWIGMGSAKAAMEASVRYFAVALAERGITVNSVSPGWTEDSVLNTLPEEVQQMIRGRHEEGWTPMKRLTTPADIGNVVSLLCSEDAGWITGQLLTADGGAGLMLAQVPLALQTG